MIRTILKKIAHKIYTIGKQTYELKMIEGIQHEGVFHIRQPQYIKYPENIYLEKNVFINTGVIIQAYATVKIGEGTTIAPNVLITTANHNIEKIGIDLWNDVIAKPVSIGKNCWIGA